jgi:hypothetical protein
VIARRAGQLLLFSIVAAALVPPVLGAPPASRNAAADPNRRICQEVGTIGTRLGRKKICATAAEWEEKRKQDRDTIDQAQRAAQVGCSVAPSSTNGPVPGC